jgi:hypothetical protein
MAGERVLPGGQDAQRFQCTQQPRVIVLADRRAVLNRRFVIGQRLDVRALEHGEDVPPDQPQPPTARGERARSGRRPPG